MKRIKTISLILLFLGASQLHGQIFSKTEIFRGTNSIKGKYYNGSGGKGYWDFKLLDSLGRIVNVKSYKKKELLSETKLVYDKYNNEIMSISLYNINNPDKVDSNWVRSYVYTEDEINKEIIKYSVEDSTKIELVKNINDSLYVYEETSYHFRKKSNKNWSHSTIHEIIKDNYGLNRKWIKDNKERKVITNYEYYQNGKIKRRTITRIPEYEIEETYLGGPGSDDQSWEYKYDKKGRVKVVYAIVGNKKYKIAKYKYK